jgi:uncharacterized protein YecT (DUF1311 family)
MNKRLKKGANEVHRKALVMFMGCASICFLVATRCGAQHMNAKDAPCQASSNAAETTCFYESSKKSDAELNQLYRRVSTVVSGDEVVKLKEAQRLWIQFRDANCAAEHELYLGGTAAPMVRLACLEAMTRHRTEELNLMYGWRLEKWSK